MESYDIYVEADGQEAVFCVSEQDVANMLIAAEARFHQVCAATGPMLPALRAARMRQARRMLTLCTALQRVFPTIKNDPYAHRRNAQAVRLFRERGTPCVTIDTTSSTPMPQSDKPGLIKQFSP